jgi:hypothetical protein
VRPVLFGIVSVTLPFPWTVVTSCGSSPTTEVRTGLSLFEDLGAGLFAITLTVLMFALLYLAPRVRPFVAALAQLLSGLLCLTILAFFHFLATFTIGDKIRVLPAGYVGLGALIVAVVEATIRFILSVLEWWWAWQDRKRAQTAD